MRYPVGARATLDEACSAAREAALLTGLRYRVCITLEASFFFQPTPAPPSEPFTYPTEL